MNRWRDYNLLYPNDEDMPDEWEPHLADGELRATPRHGHRDETLDAVIEWESFRECLDRIKPATSQGESE